MPQPYLKPIVEIDIIRQNNGGIRDDNWTSGWTIGGTGATASTDGDILTLTGGSTVATYTKTISALATATWTTFVFRVVSASGSGNISFQVTETGGLNDILTFAASSVTVPTVKQLTLTTGRTTATIVLSVDPGVTVKADYVTICKAAATVLTSQDDAIGPDATMSTTAVNDATFKLRNNGGAFTTGANALNLYDVVYIYMGYLQDDLQTRKLSKVFGGSIMEMDPTLDDSGDLLQVNCSGWAQALLNVFVVKDYGSSSDNPLITTFQAMINDMISTFVVAGGAAGSYQLTTTYLQNISGPPAITYMLFKNDYVFDAIKQAVDLLTAGDPTTATVYPAEFWVDNAENCHLAPLGAWGSDPNPSTYPNTLSVGSEHITNNFRKDILNLKNKIHFITAYVNPPNRDAFTENNSSSWDFRTNGTGGTVSKSDDSSAGNFKVNSFSVKGSWSSQSPAPTTVQFSYPVAANLALDTTKLGGKITPPRIVVFYKTDQNTTAYSQVQFATQAVPSSAVFTSDPIPLAGTSDTNWRRIEYRFGPYGDRFVAGPSADWTNINQIQLLMTFIPGPTSGNFWIDGLYLEGQNHWIATDSTRQNQYGTREASLTSLKHRAGLTNQALAKAELFRLHNPVTRGEIHVPGIPDVLPGQKLIVNAPSANLTSATLRVLSAKHHFGQDGLTTTLELTDDLTNYQALKVTSMADLLLQIHTPTTKAQREKDVEMGGPATLSGQPDFTTVAQTKDYPS